MDNFYSIKEARLAAEAYVDDDFRFGTDLPSLNACLPHGGFRKGQLALIQGAGTSGKTTIALNLVVQAVRRAQVQVLFFSLRQSAADIEERLLRIVIGCDPQERKNTPELEEAKRCLASLVVIDDLFPGTETSKLRERVRDYKGELPVLIVIDKIDDLTPHPDTPLSIQESEEARGKQIIEELSELAKHSQAFCLALQELRGVEAGVGFGYQENRFVTQEADFADYLIISWLPALRANLTSEVKENLRGTCCINLAKNRHGALRELELIYSSDSLRLTENPEI